VADPQPSPSEFVSRKEQLEHLKASLTAEEHEIFDLRSAGLEWDEIASRLGGSGQARRMQLSRGIERLRRQLGLAD
jgi:DNA-directed RNA polymerase specialized sigma24 family protein